jgi:TP901 family phage tail tape measure protein
MADDMILNINVTGTNSSGGAFEALDSSIRGVMESLNSVSRAAQTFGETIQRAMGGPAAQAGRQMETSMNAAQRGIQNASSAAQNMNQTMDQLGKGMAAELIGQQLEHMGEVGMKAFEACIQSAATFEFNISRISAVLTTVGKASNDQIGQMSELALKLGSNSSFSANEIAEGMYTLARQGLDATTIMGNGVNGAINVVNDLAQATDSTMTDTATVITDVVHEYGLSGNSLREVANIMSGALHNSSESLDDFYQSMKQVGPVAANMHQNAMDMSTALALLAQHGITGSSAGTALKNMLLGLEPRTKKAADLMKELGISAKDGAANSFYQLNGNLKPLPEIIDVLNQKYNGLNDKQKQAALSATFTKYGLAGLNVVVGQSRDSFMKFQEELKADDAATIAAKKLDNLHGDMLKFNAGVQTMMKSFGDSVGTMLRPLTQAATQAVKAMAELPKPVKEFSMILLGVGSVILSAGGALLTFGGAIQLFGPTLAMAGLNVAKFQAFVGLLGKAFTGFLIPAGVTIGVIAAVALAFKLAYDHIKPFHDAVNNVISSVQQVAGALKGLWQGGAVEGKGISILDNLGFSSSAISVIQNSISTIKSGIAGIGQAFNNVKSFAQGFFMILSGTGGGKGISILQKLGIDKGTIQSLMQIGGQIRAAFNSIRQIVSTSLNQIGNTAKQALNKIFTFWNQHHQQIQQTGKQVWNGISTFIRTAIGIVTPIIAAFTNVVLPIVVEIFRSIWQTAVQVFNGLVQTIGAALQAIFTWWNSIWPQIQVIVTTVWNVIKVVIGAAFAVILPIIIAALGFIKGAWENGWNAIKAALSFAWDAIKGVIQIAWHLISGIISIGLDVLTGNWGKAWNDIKKTFSNVWDDIKGTFKNLIGDALDFGKNFVQMIAKGITGAVGAVKDAVSGVADKIKGFLGFASPTKEGPASKSDKWGPNFVNMVAKGIQDYTPKIQAAVNGIALTMKTGITSPITNNVSQSMALPSGAGGGNVYNITVHANGNVTRNEKELGKIVSREIFDMAKMQGRI